MKNFRPSLQVVYAMIGIALCVASSAGLNRDDIHDHNNIGAFFGLGFGALFLVAAALIKWLEVRRERKQEKPSNG